MRTHFEYDIYLRSQRLADLKNEAAELERKLNDVHVSLERELAQAAGIPAAMPDQFRESYPYAQADVGGGEGADEMPGLFAELDPPGGYGGANSGSPEHWPEGRTEVLVSHGRRSAYSRTLSRGRMVMTATALVAVLITILVVALPGAGASASWPSSVATVQSEAARACQNPDVQSEPSQVNFACAKATRQILWVFALMTSADNPNFADTTTGRRGLEPITPLQGGEVAWSLNLHHPYSPSNPIDSLEVAARAINNIIGGATLTRASGQPAVQSGLESDSANCRRYTGSPAVISREGFPRLCAKPVTIPAGQAALVADVFQKWIVSAGPNAARDAAVLFENADSPGAARVQAILKHLPDSKLLA